VTGELTASCFCPAVCEENSPAVTALTGGNMVRSSFGPKRVDPLSSRRSFDAQGCARAVARHPHRRGMMSKAHPSKAGERIIKSNHDGESLIDC
jgi:hypothetical protein